MDFDTIVIGGGPGGYLAAQRLGQAGRSVLLIEKKHIGGTCLNEGCIPTKTLLHSAKLYRSCLGGIPYGISCGGLSYDQRAVVSRKRKVTAGLVSGVKAGLRTAGVKILEAVAHIEGQCNDGFRISASDGSSHLCRHLIIASGSSPVIPDIPGLRSALDSGFALTSTELLEIEKIPESLCVIGGGVIGLEMAVYFALTGSRVSVVEASDKIVGELDCDIRKVVQNECEKLGIRFYLSSKASGFGGVSSVKITSGGKDEVISCEKVLMCIGRLANTSDFGLDNINVPLSDFGIETDEHCMTGIPDVYAVGDCCGRSMQAHVAYRQAEVAAATILGKNDYMRWLCVPGLVHTFPEAAFAGYTEEQARAHGIEIAVSKISMNYSGLYMAENEGGTGIIKLVFDKKKRSLIGAHIVGGPASEMISLCSILIDSGLPIERLRKYVFPHPTNMEAIKEAIFAVKL